MTSLPVTRSVEHATIVSGSGAASASSTVGSRAPGDRRLRRRADVEAGELYIGETPEVMLSGQVVTPSDDDFRLLQDRNRFRSAEFTTSTSEPCFESTMRLNNTTYNQLPVLHVHPQSKGLNVQNGQKITNKKLSCVRRERKPARCCFFAAVTLTLAQ